MGSNALILLFALFVHAAFVLLIKLSLSLPTSFLTFTLPVLSPIPMGGGVSKWLSDASLPDEVKP